MKILLTDIFVHLQLKSKKFCVFSSASTSEIALFWDAMLSVDSALADPHGKKIQEGYPCKKPISLKVF